MAGITHLEQFKKPALRGFVEASQKAHFEELAFVEQFIGNDTTYNTNFAYDVLERSQFIAAMIGLGAEKPVVDRHKAGKVMGELAHFGLQDVVSIEELYAINQARNDAEKSAMIEKLLNKSADLLFALQLRIRVEKLKALALGKNTYDKNGVKVELDYGIPEAHKIALLSKSDWKVKDRDVLADLLGWVEIYRKSNGRKPDAMLVPREVVNALTDNKTIVAEARPNVPGATRVSVAEVNEVLGRYGLPELQIVEETEVETTDLETGKKVSTVVFPKNRIVFAAKNAGVFLTGPNPDDENFAPVTTLEAYDLRTPKRSVLEVAQTGFAILDKPSLVLHADVFGGDVSEQH